MSVSRALFASTSGTGPSSSSSKAPFRPGKAPIKRTDSIVSLPSPPAEISHTYSRKRVLEDEVSDVLGPRLEPGFGMDLARGRTTLDRPAFEDEEESRFSDDSEEEEDLPRSRRSSARNPFLDPSSASGSTSRRERERRPDHPQSSPTHQRRKRLDKERISLGAPLALFPRDRTPPAVPAKMGRGWEDSSNPFLEGNTKPKKGKAWRKGEAVAPEKVTYVFRGKRITYDLPLSALLNSPDSPGASPSDNPFSSTTPRLLFPPKESTTTPPNSGPSQATFLDTLRQSAPVSPRKRPAEEDVFGSYGLPTPVQDKKKKKSSAYELKGLVR